MHTRAKIALALGLSLVAGTLQAAPWEHAGSKFTPENSNTQVRRSTRAYSYSPPATTAAPTMAQVPAAVQAPIAPRAQTVAPTTVAPRAQAATAAPQARGYRSYSYQPQARSNNNASQTRTPFYLRADSKIMARGY